jgi:hypothetical protein
MALLTRAIFSSFIMGKTFNRGLLPAGNFMDLFRDPPIAFLIGPDYCIPSLSSGLIFRKLEELRNEEIV